MPTMLTVSILVKDQPADRFAGDDLKNEVEGEIEAVLSAQYGWSTTASISGVEQVRQVG